MPEPRPKFHPVIFRDALGRFLPQSKRYSDEVALVQMWRSGRYVDIGEHPIPAKQLVNVLSQPEFERLKEATQVIQSVESGRKYKAWDVSQQINKTKGIRRKDIKYTVVIDDAGRKRKLSFYHRIKRNTDASYSLFRRINDEIGFAGYFLYDRFGGKILADRKGKQVKLLEVIMEEVI